MIRIFGYLGELSEQLRSEAAAADLVVGGVRHLDALEVDEPRRQVLGTIAPAIERIQSLPADAKVVVVASGDPLLWGVTRRIRQAGLKVEVIPEVSSLQALFAKIALPWDDAQLVSGHGGGFDEVLHACRVHPKVGILTAPKRGAVEIAQALEDVERWYVVGEKLGEVGEQVGVYSRDELLTRGAVGSPHVVLVLTNHPDDDAVLGHTPVLQGDAFTAEDSHDASSTDSADDDAVVDVQGLRVAQITNSDAARRHAEAIDAGLGVESVRYDGPAARGLAAAWAHSDLIISHLATGATTRLIAPLLKDKKTDPGVVVVDEAGRFAVPLVGGHVGGANDLARRIGEALGATPVVTTATDSVGIPALDQLEWAYSGDVAGVTRAILDGRPVLVERTAAWPLPALPANVAEEAQDPAARIVVTDAASPEPSELPTVLLHPKSLVVGMGCNAGVSYEELLELLEKTLAEANLSIESVAALTSHEVKAGELGMLKLANSLGIPYHTYGSEELARHEVPNPSSTVSDAVGTPSVSEASVLARGAELIVEKQKSPVATCAIGRLPARGELLIVGLGPGSRDLLTPRAVKAIQDASFIAGYAPYVKQIRDLARPGTQILATKMGTEEQRIRAAIDAAREGKRVAFVCGGDPAIYAMASPTFEMGTEGIDVTVVPGVTAELAASAILGAPLGHDHATISLSDLHTDWELIVDRLEAAAQGDFVVALYNPRSRTRVEQLPTALEIFAKHRPPTTPVALVSHADRKQQEVVMSTLADFQPEWVDMNTIVIVGSTTSKFVPSGDGEQRFVTPRDYHWMDGRVSAEQRKNYSHKDKQRVTGEEYHSRPARSGMVVVEAADKEQSND